MNYQWNTQTLPDQLPLYLIVPASLVLLRRPAQGPWTHLPPCALLCISERWLQFPSAKGGVPRNIRITKWGGYYLQRNCGPRLISTGSRVNFWWEEFVKSQDEESSHVHYVCIALNHSDTLKSPGLIKEHLYNWWNPQSWVNISLMNSNRRWNATNRQIFGGEGVCVSVHVCVSH